MQISLMSQIIVKPAHPRILLDSALIVKLKSRALSNTTEYQQLVTRISAVSAYNAQYIMTNVYGGEQYAFMYALSFYATGNTAHRDSAVNIFKEYFTNYTQDSTMYYDSGYESRSTMVDVAMLYDWLYNYLTPAFRTTVRNRLIHWGNWILTNPNVYGIWTGPYYYEGNNYTMGHFVGITSVGFAIQSEDAINGNRFISKSDSIRPYLMNYANTRLKNGDANEGWGYGAGYAVNYFKALAIYKTATGGVTNHFLSTTYDEDVIKFLPFATLPDLSHMLPEGDWARESTGELWEFHRLVADLVSSYSNTGLTQQTAVFWARETVPFSKFAVTAYRWFPFLFSNQEITPLDYRPQPLYQTNYIYTDTVGTDQFIGRTGWNANSLWVSYRAGGRYGDHSHNGSGHFSVYDNGWLLIDKNISTTSGIEGSDSMHNCIHIQKMNNIEMYPFKDPIEHSIGIRRDLNAEYSYLWSNSTPIYKARSVVFNCVNNNARQFLFIPGLNKMAIFDNVTTVSSNDKKWFGLNYYGNPSFSNDSSYSFYSNASKTVYAHTCYPLNKAGIEFNNSVRISYKTNQQKNYFMHLVSVQSNSSTPVAAIPVNPANGRVVYSDFYGSYHPDVTRDYCILFAGDGFNNDSLIYEVPATTQVLRSYIAGLGISNTYYVSYTNPSAGVLRIKVSTLYHANSTAYISSGGGVLKFDVPDMVGITEIKNDSLQFHVYYNKSLEEIYVENLNESNSNVQVTLYDAMGKLVVQDEMNGSRFKQVPVNTLARGVYMISLEGSSKPFRSKLVIY